MLIQVVLIVIAGYLLGSIPSAYIVARLKKRIDIRQAGSGNVGALNVYREIGPAYGITVLITDLAKGALAVFLARWFDLHIFWVCLAGFAAVAGHNWPIFLKFKGGKGAATILGVLLLLLPVPWSIGLGIAIIIIVITSNVRLGIIGIAIIPLAAWLLQEPPVLVIFSLLLFLFLVIVTAAGLVKEISRKGSKRGLIFDRDYHFWQIKKKK